MTEAMPSVVLEGVGYPESKVVTATQDGVAKWFKQIFTLHGREEAQRNKLVRKFTKINTALPVDKREEAAKQFSETLDHKAHSKAVVSIVRDTVVGGLVVVGGVLAWKNRGAIELIARAMDTVRLEAQQQLKQYDRKALKALPIKERVEIIAEAIAEGKDIADDKIERVIDLAEGPTHRFTSLSLEQASRQVLPVLRRAHRLLRK